MARVNLDRVPQWYHGYVNLVKEEELGSAFQNQNAILFSFLKAIPPEKRKYRYAADKWTLHDIVQHLIDAERIFAYRATCFSRKDSTPLPSFDESAYAQNAGANSRNWNEMLEEFELLRESSILFFKSLTEEQLETMGTASTKQVYVRAIGFIMVGHVTHHLNVIKERYL